MILKRNRASKFNMEILGVLFTSPGTATMIQYYRLTDLHLEDACKWFDVDGNGTYALVPDSIVQTINMLLFLSLELVQMGAGKFNLPRGVNSSCGGGGLLDICKITLCCQVAGFWVYL